MYRTIKDLENTLLSDEFCDAFKCDQLVESAEKVEGCEVIRFDELVFIVSRNESGCFNLFLYLDNAIARKGVTNVNRYDFCYMHHSLTRADCANLIAIQLCEDYDTEYRVVRQSQNRH